MDNTESPDWFDGVNSVITEPLKFKAKLAIGEDAYTSLRLKNTVTEYWDALGAATTVAGIAKSSAVATAFFAPKGLLAAIGIGAATTPIGWVIAAGVITGGAWVGITRYIKNESGKNVIVIPVFLNTPMDVLALALFDFLAPLSLKIATVDGSLDGLERSFIKERFINDWGYNEAFVNDGIAYIETNLTDFSIRELARSLAEFKKGNPDCNYREMTRETLDLLRSIIESDGKIDEREEMAIENVEGIFNDVNKVHIKNKIKVGWSKFRASISNVTRKHKHHPR